MATITRRTALASGAALALSAGTARAQAVNFAGKRITMIVPYQEGSGSTIHGRLFAMALEKSLPGNPTIVIRNIDGGGSVRGYGYQRIGPRDANGRLIAK